MKFQTVRVYYRYTTNDHEYSQDYTVPENEPHITAHAVKQWQRDLNIPHQHVAMVGAEILPEEFTRNPVVQLPIGFTETRYPGYFWDTHSKKLYSLKSGMLKEIKYQKSRMVRGKIFREGYPVSHLGKRKRLERADLLKLTPERCVVPLFPVQKPKGSRWS